MNTVISTEKHIEYYLLNQPQNNSISGKEYNSMRGFLYYFDKPWQRERNSWSTVYVMEINNTPNLMVYCHVMNTRTYQRDCFNLGNSVFLQVNHSSFPFFSICLFISFIRPWVFGSGSQCEFIVDSELTICAKLVSNLWHLSYLCLPNARWACCSTCS